ncbi:hypothetical protein Mboo_2069 [Methanoregula boonei 6A8]|jgi:hypothetical protein|uniref:DUF357 domain-containing protein n=1 Tax=Methanoregula boonei (strain DSM 21154 / JCM 14090 / 6A8) TaxID=456442 RepID=A7IA22_METB6|nr:DUF357 domain-containing protein [Methanoregula boonei]ABS56583.1 hypothetical protein Mboo_2069 [Methanoregula boonei 6A8]
MLIAGCGSLLSRELEETRIPQSPETPLFALAITAQEMARAYAEDGATFFSRDDPVNALAAYYYGFGWLHFGIAYGLLSRSGKPACPFDGQHETLPLSQTARLDEKVQRYARLLDTACASVVPAPEPETAAGAFARKVIVIGTSYARGGRSSLAAGEREAALARFSYGHGWVDAGARAGLLALTGNREIFTV